MLLVGAIAVGEHLSSRYVAKLVAAADRQQAVVAESLLSETLLSRIEIAGREIRTATSPDQVALKRAELQKAADQARAKLSELQGLITQEGERAQIATVADLTGTYISSLEEIAEKQTGILSLFSKLDAAESEWTVAFNRLVNSDAFTFLPNASSVEGLMGEAGSAFKDARSATWRYFVLRESSQVLRITGAADQAVEKLVYAERDIKDEKLGASIQKLQQLVPAYVSILKRIAELVASQSELLSTVVTPTEVRMQALLEQMAQESTALSERATENSVAGAATMNRLRVLAGVVVVALLIGVALFGVFNIAHPIQNIGSVLVKLSAGETAVAIPYLRRTDEIGATARAAGIFKDNLSRMAEIEAAQTELTRQAQIDRKAAMDHIASTFEQTIGEIVNSISTTSVGLEQSARVMRRATDVTKQLTSTLASTAEQASANVNSVSRSTEEISSFTADIAQQSRTSSDLAHRAVQEARNTDRRMAELASAAQRIDDVVGLITQIAGKTNLLALNATIEAARAGEAGRGFAIVAAEVKQLAKQTAEATKEITSYVASIQTASKDSATALKQIEDTVDKLAEIASMVANAVHEQETTTRTISEELKEVAAGAADVVSKITQVDKEARDAESASVDVLASARTLAAGSSKLRADATGFVTMVRSAN